MDHTHMCAVLVSQEQHPSFDSIQFVVPTQCYASDAHNAQ